ncbi:Fras1 related extracellular matrix protein, partial [Elysia marginata]
MNSSSNFYKQPNWMYFYFSGSADVNANPNILNGSAFYFDNDCHYPNWYTTLAFNKTLPLFGPKVYRHDDYGDQGNFLREPTRTTAVGMDAGAGRFMNYSRKEFKMNPWYDNWLPDLKGDMDSLTKFTYYIGIKESNVT